ncbi:hypothetical protein [Demequina sp. NBRC 110055]|uniref:hypothetical protein n=1 Tax=Demequina sp. NBRC 110055 TaxID=1570344 RepID=UPI000A002E08|nr:hypothetical protein [Demequina sp. NBRC 110055]
MIGDPASIVLDADEAEALREVVSEAITAAVAVGLGIGVAFVAALWIGSEGVAWLWTRARARRARREVTA